MLLPPFVVGIVCAIVCAFVDRLSVHYRPILLSMSIQPLPRTARHWLVLFCNICCSFCYYFVCGLRGLPLFVGDQRQNYCVRRSLCVCGSISPSSSKSLPALLRILSVIHFAFATAHITSMSTTTMLDHIPIHFGHQTKLPSNKFINTVHTHWLFNASMFQHLVINTQVQYMAGCMLDA